MSINELEADLDVALDAAIDACREALSDYRAGLIDRRELRDALVTAGVVTLPGQAWVLDLGSNRWWRYDGVALDAESGRTTGSAVARLRDVIDELAAEEAGR